MSAFSFPIRVQLAAGQSPAAVQAALGSATQVDGTEIGPPAGSGAGGFEGGRDQDSESRTVRLVLRLARPLPWAAVRESVCAAAGLAPGTVLYQGVGPVEDNWLVGTPPLLAGCVIGTRPVAAHPHRPPLVLSVIAGPDAGAWVPMGAEPLTVGRDEAADLRLRDPSASRAHARISPHPSGLIVADLGSTNGVFVDGRPAGSSTVATTGSVIRVGGTLLQVELTTEPVGGFAPDGRGYLARGGRPARFQERLPSLPPRPTPPAPPPRRSLPVLTALIGAAVGGALALVLHNPMFLAFAAFGPLTMIGSAVGDRVRGRRSYSQQRADYRHAIAQWRDAAASRTQAERLARWRRWPGPGVLARRAQVGSARLWDRRPADADYLQVAAGCGAAPLLPDGPATADVSPSSREGPAPVATTRAPRRLRRHTDADAGEDDEPSAPTVDDVPVVIPLAAVPVVIPLAAVPGGVVAFVGETERAVARYVVSQLLTTHAPGDLALAVIGGSLEWSCCRDLPHSLHLSSTEGLLAGAGGRDVVVLLDGAAVRSPLGVSVLSAAGAIPAQPGLGPDRERRVIVLVLAGSADELPVQAVPLTSVIASVSAAGGAQHLVGYTAVSPALFAEICGALTPLRDGGAAAAHLDPGSADVTLAEVGDAAGALDAAALRARWADNLRGRARAVLGVTVGNATGEPLALDLDADGPHLLIAGTTGSGKSELLQTLVTSMATDASPQAVTFLLVDYKGGAAFGPIRGLPHVVGMLTDLDSATSARALASLRAELRHREHVQAAGEPRPPRLVVVIDEFATLAAELPEFLAGVLDIAQRGRSLGLHLVLATQRPAGVVSPAMRANISARLCLRVTDPADSLDVLGIPDAAMIPASRPGRAVLRTGEGITAFQTARVSVPAPPAIIVSGGIACSTPTGEAIVDSVVRAAAEAASGLPTPRRPWLEPLPAVIDAVEQPDDVLAWADLPDEQAQRPLPAPEKSVLVVGPAGSGRSAALRRIAQIAARRGEELLVVDGADGLADLADWPEVSSYLPVHEPRLVQRLLTLLTDPTRRPSDGRIRHLLVDHYDVVVAELDRADYLRGSALLTDLAARAAGEVRISAAGPERLAQQRAASSFAEIIALGGGPTRGALAFSSSGADRPGRGQWRSAEVQLVHLPRRPLGTTSQAPDAESSRARPPSEVRLPGATITPQTPEPNRAEEHHNGQPTWRDRLIVRPLPALVRSSELPPASAGQVTIGIGGDTAAPCTLDLSRTSGGIVIAGPRRSGVTTALATLAEQAAAAGIPVLRVRTGRDLPRSAVAPARGASEVADDPASAGAATRAEETVTPALRSAADGTTVDHIADTPQQGQEVAGSSDPATAPRQGRITDIDCGEDGEALRAALAAHDGPLLLVADHHGLGDDHPAAAVLDRLLTVCGPGQHLAIGARTEVLARARRGHLHAALAHRRGLLLAPDAMDGTLFDIPVPKRQGVVTPGRGLLIWDAPPIPIQVSPPATCGDTDAPASIPAPACEQAH